MIRAASDGQKDYTASPIALTYSQDRAGYFQAIFDNNPNTGYNLAAMKAKLLRVLEGNSTSRYSGKISEGDPNDDPDVKQFLTKRGLGERIATRLEEEKTTDATGSQTSIRTVKVYYVYTPPKTTNRRLPEVEGSVNANLYGGLLSANVNFEINGDTGIYAQTRMRVATPDNGNIPKPIRNRTLGEVEGTFKLAFKKVNGVREVDSGNSYVQVSARKILFFINEIRVKTTFDGNVSGLVDVKWIPDIHFGPSPVFKNFYSGNRQELVQAQPEFNGPVLSLAGNPDGSAPTTLDEPMAEDPTIKTVPDDVAAALPATMRILSVTPIPGTRKATIVYQVENATPDTKVNLYATLTEGDYQGEAIAYGIPVGTGPLTYVWDNFADYIPTPYDPNVPVYVFGVTEGGEDNDIFSDFSEGVTTAVNYDPEIVLPNSVEYRADRVAVFSADQGNAILISDPLGDDALLTLTLSTTDGDLKLLNTPADVIVENNDSHFIQLKGNAAMLNMALEGMTYTAESGFYLDDVLEIGLDRANSLQPGQIIKHVKLNLSPLALGLLVANKFANTANREFSDNDDIAWIEGDGWTAPTLTVTGSVPQAVFADLTIDSTQSDRLNGARIAIGNYIAGHDALSFEDTADIQGQWDSLHGVLTLTGNATVEDYTDALRSVTFVSDLDGARELTLKVIDTTGEAADLDFPMTILPGDGTPITLPATSTLPMLDTGLATVEYTNGKTGVTLAPELTIGNAPVLIGAFITLTGNFDSDEDRLTFTPAFGISGSYDHMTGELELHGTASAAAYQQVLRSVKYLNLRANPATFDRIATFLITDGTLVNDLDFSTVTIALNPVVVETLVQTNATPITVPEGGAAMELVPSLTLTNPDAGATDADPSDEYSTAGETLIGATIVIDNYVKGEDVLEAEGGPNIIPFFDDDTGTLYLSGLASLAEYQSVLRFVTYRNLNPSPDTTPRTITFLLEDVTGDDRSFTQTVTPQNLGQTPQLTMAIPSLVTLPSKKTQISLGLSNIQYQPPAGMLDLVYTITAVPDAAVGNVVLATGLVATVGSKVTLADLQGAVYQSVSLTASGLGTFSFDVAGLNPVTNVPDSNILSQSITIDDQYTVPTIVEQLPTVIAAGSGKGVVGTVNVVDSSGETASLIKPFGDRYTSGVRTATGDVNGDGTTDYVFGTGDGVTAQVVVLDGKTQQSLFSINPFGDTFTRGVFVAAGDVNNDGYADFAITPERGGGARVRLFDGKTFSQLADFFGIDDPKFRGGARQAIGDINGDHYSDLIVAAGIGGGPRIAIFDGTTLAPDATPTHLVGDFFAFEPKLRNGVFVSAGDIDGDGYADIAFGAGPGGGPRVKILSGATLAFGSTTTAVANPLKDFFAGCTANRNGIRVAVKNLNDDPNADLVTGSGDGDGAHIITYSGSDFSILNETDAFESSTGIFVG
ncbi:hypothetical protein BH11PLA2_BH11PLA2_17330 [soil metagenome]